MSSATPHNCYLPRTPKGCCAKRLSFYHDFEVIGSPKRGLEPDYNQIIQGEPETKRLRHSEVSKPSECPQCGHLFLDPKKLKQHRLLHTADTIVFSWIDQDIC